MKKSENESKNTLLQHYYEEDNAKSYFANNQIEIPDEEKVGFSFRKLWAFTGPGLLMSIAYLDPGNIESDLQSGTLGRYELLWVLFAATILAFVMQCLATKLGVVTGLDLSEWCRKQYKKYPRILLWMMIEVPIIASAMQQVIGTAIGLYLLSEMRISLYIGCLVPFIDTLTFRLLNNYGLRKLEFLFAIVIGIMALTFGYEYVISSPPQKDVFEGLFIPRCANWDSKVLLQAVGIIGAVTTPHNLYIHSALVKSRAVDRKNVEKLKEARMYFFIETALAMTCSMVINILVLGVFANGLYDKSNSALLEDCKSNDNMYQKAIEVFPNNSDNVEADIYKGGIYLGCAYGTVALYIWSLGVLAAVQSCTMTGSYSGQFVMQGFLKIHCPPWKRVFYTRCIAIVPILLAIYFNSLDGLTIISDLANVSMSLQLPFAVIPTITFTSNPKIMGQFVNGLTLKIISMTLSIVVVGINIFFVVQKISSLGLNVFYLMLIALGAVIYFALVIYLSLHLYVSLNDKYIGNKSFVKKYVVVELTKRDNPCETIVDS